MKKTLLIVLAVLLAASLCFVSCKQEPPHEHSLTKVAAVPATCEAAGNTEYYTCDCGKIFSDSAAEHEISQADTVVAATGHNWGNWSVTTDPTYIAKGEKTRTCSNCDAAEHEAVDKIPLEVETFAAFKAAFDITRSEGDTFTIKLTDDLAWEGDAFAPVATGITIDLNDHSISGIPNNSFTPSGNSFTIMNGSILLDTALTGTYQKAISIGFSDTLTGKDYSTKEALDKAVVFDDVELNGGAYLGDGVFIFNNCTIETSKPKTRGICCYSGAVILNGTTVKTGANASGTEVALYGREAGFILNDGTVIDSANHGIQPYNNSSLITNGAVTIKAAGNYAIYTNYASYTRTDGLYKNVVALGAGANVTSGVNGLFAMTFGDVYTIADGVTLTGAEGTTEPKYAATPISAKVGTAKKNGYIGWSAGKGDTAGNATITDNRVLD